MKQEVREKLETTLAKYNISKAKASREMGYSPAVISAYTSGSYAGDIDKLEDGIIRWVARQVQAHSRKHVPVVETGTLKTILNAIELAHSEHDIALIIADAGGGKTTAAKYYADRNDKTVVFIPVVAGMNRRMLVNEIAKQLLIETSRVQFNQLVQNISDTLLERDSLRSE